MSQINIDLGCGMKKPEGWIGVDNRAFEGVDHVLDIGKDPLPFEDNSVDEIRAIHLFEHLYPEQLFFVMDECFRVMKPLGKLHIEVPKAGTPAYYVHPDHKLQFMPDTFGFFQTPAEGMDRHGYLKGFWHVSVLDSGFEEHIHVDLYPNKPQGKYPYTEVRQAND